MLKQAYVYHDSRLCFHENVGKWRGKGMSMAENRRCFLKSLVTLLAVFVLLVGVWRPAFAVSATDKGAEAGMQSKATADKKPAKCIGLVNMSNGMVLPKGTATANVKYIYVHKDKLYDGSSEQTGDYNGKYDLLTQIVRLTVKAGVFENFEVRAIVPFLDKQVKRKAGKTLDTSTDSVTGLGDVVLMGRYALLTQRDGGWLNLAVGAGLKMPTGDYDKDNPAPYSNTHEYMGPSFQLGSGSWDPKFELGATKFFGRSRVDAHAMATFPGDGAHDSRLGDQFKYDLGYGYALNRSFDVEMELNGVYKDADWYDNDLSQNTGGHTVYVTPGVHWKIDKSWHLSLGVPIVVFRDLNGASATPDSKSTYGIGEDFQVVVRLGVCF